VHKDTTACGRAAQIVRTPPCTAMQEVETAGTVRPRTMRWTAADVPATRGSTATSPDAPADLPASQQLLHVTQVNDNFCTHYEEKDLFAILNGW
jgi:hypothetical protein